MKTRLPPPVCVYVRAGGKWWLQGSASTQTPHLCPHSEASPVHRFQGLALLNLAAGKSSLCRPGTQRQSATGKSHPRGVFNELWRHCSCAQGAGAAAGPASLTQPRPLGPNIAWSCVRTTQCGRLKAKKKKKKIGRGRKILEIPCPSNGRALLENQQQGKGCCPPRQGASGSGRKLQVIF